MARPRKPTQLKIIKGTAQKCRMNPDEPQPSTGDMTPPDHLSELAKKHFAVLVSRLDGIGCASDTFTEIAALAASAFDTWQICEAVIERQGIMMMMPGACGEMYPKEHPAVGTRQKAWQTYRMCLTHMGLTQSDISKVHGKKKEPEKKGKWAL